MSGCDYALRYYQTIEDLLANHGRRHHVCFGQSSDVHRAWSLLICPRYQTQFSHLQVRCSKAYALNLPSRRPSTQMTLRSAQWGDPNACEIADTTPDAGTSDPSESWNHQLGWSMDAKLSKMEHWVASKGAGVLCVVPTRKWDLGTRAWMRYICDKHAFEVRCPLIPNVILGSNLPNNKRVL